MWHVDDGILNAYLDGELRAGSGERGAAEQGAGSRKRGAEGGESGTLTATEVESHLADCTECAALLEEVQRVRDRAAAILASSSPTDLVAPPFEEIRARAAARDTSSRVLQLTRVRRLAWAATIMLAVAVGWYARGTVFPSRAEQMMAPQQSAVASDSDEEVGSRERGAESEEQGAERRQSESQEVAATVRATDLDEAGEPVNRDVAGRGAAAEVETQPATPPAEIVAAAAPGAKAAADVESKGEIVDVSRDRRGRADAADRLAAEAPRIVMQQVAPGEPAPTVGGITVGEVLLVEDSMWVEATEDQARDVLGGDVPVVRDLPVLDYWVSLLGGRDVVRVRQRLEDRFLELVVSRVVTPDRLQAGVMNQIAANQPEDAAATTTQSITLQIGDYEVVLRGSVSQDSLRVLGERVGG